MEIDTHIELVIKIDKDTYNDIQSHDWKNGGRWYSEEWKAIHNGTPLPKGHGTLKDVDNIKTAFPSGEYVRTESVRATIDHEDTIIEADKGNEG